MQIPYYPVYIITLPLYYSISNLPYLFEVIIVHTFLWFKQSRNSMKFFIFREGYSDCLFLIFYTGQVNQQNVDNSIFVLRPSVSVVSPPVPCRCLPVWLTPSQYPHNVPPTTRSQVTINSNTHQEAKRHLSLSHGGSQHSTHHTTLYDIMTWLEVLLLIENVGWLKVSTTLATASIFIKRRTSQDSLSDGLSQALQQIRRD